MGAQVVPATPPPRSYDAFMSYSHAADGTLAPQVQQALRRFLVPWYRWTGRDVFRDETGLALTEQLWPDIRRALDHSQAFVLLMSPAAADSPWVQREIDHWLTLDRPLPVLVLTEGDPPRWTDPGDGTGRFAPEKSPVPPNLADAYVHEPKWVDLRWYRATPKRGRRDPRLRQALAEITAAIEGKPLEEILDLDAHHRRLLRVTITAVVLVLVVALSWALLSLIESRRQLADNHISQARLLYVTQPARSRLHFARAANVAGSWWSMRALVDQDAVARAWLGIGFRQGPPVTMWHPGYWPMARLSESGDRILTWSLDGTLRLWDAATGDPISETITTGPRRIDSAEFDRSGNRLIVAITRDDRVTVEIRDGTSGRVIDTPVTPDDGVTSVEWNGDSGRLATVTKDGSMTVHDIPGAATPAPRRRWPNGVQLVRFSPDGRRLVVHDEARHVSIWDTQRDDVIPLSMQLLLPTSSHVSEDGRLFAVAPDEHRVEIRRMDDGRLVGPPLTIPEAVNFAVFTRDSTRVVTSGHHDSSPGAPSTIRMWDVDSGREVLDAIRYGNLYESPTLTDDGRYLFTQAKTTARLWDLGTGEPVGRELQLGEQIANVAWPDDGRRVVLVGLNGVVRVWSVPDGVPVTAPLEHQGHVTSAAFMADGRRVLTASRDGTVRAWPIEAGAFVGHVLAAGETAAAHEAAIHAAQFSPRGDLVVTGSADGRARLWDAHTGRLVRTLEHGAQVTHVEFGRDGDVVATVGGTKVTIWDVGTGRTLRVLEHPARASSASFGGSGRRLVTGCDDGVAYVWDAASGRQLAAFREHTKAVTHVTFAPDGQRVLSCSDDGSARIWIAATGHQTAAMTQYTPSIYMGTFDRSGRRVALAQSAAGARVYDARTGTPLSIQFTNPNGIKSVAFSPDGGRLLAAGLDGTAQVWDVASGRETGLPLRHTGAVWGAAFDPSGRRVATGSFDRTLAIWDVDSGLPIVDGIRHDAELFAVAFSSDGRRLLTATVTGQARIWDVAAAEASSAELTRAAEHASVMTLDASGGTIRMLDQAEWRRVSAPDAASPFAERRAP